MADKVYRAREASGQAPPFQRFEAHVSTCRLEILYYRSRVQEQLVKVVVKAELAAVDFSQGRPLEEILHGRRGVI